MVSVCACLLSVICLAPASASADGPVSTVTLPSAAAEVWVQVESKSAEDAADVSLSSPASVTVCDDCEAGNEQDLGAYAAGDLVFTFTDATCGESWLSTDTDHVEIDQIGPEQWQLNYDDAGGGCGGGDGDFNDLVVDVSAGVPPVTAPEQFGPANSAMPGICTCGQSPGEPVNTATGDFYDTSTDTSVGSFGPAVAFTRTYDSGLAQQQAAAGVPGGLGYGWADNWEMSLALGDPSSGDVTVRQADGAEATFVAPVSGSCPVAYVGPGTSGTFCALPDVTATLTYDSSTSTYTFTTRPYMVYKFNSSGKLTGESGPGGAAVTLTYDSPSPGSGECPSSAASCTTVASASGRALVIAYNSSGLITRVTNPLGAWVSNPGSVRRV
jgi:hypothetical protein